MSLELIFWSVVAVVVLIGVPIGLIWTMVDYFRGKGSTRRGTGGFTAGVAAAMQELDRMTLRPSAEHQIEAEHQTLKREDDSGSD